MNGIAIIIQGANYSKRGLGKVTIKGAVPPEPLYTINYLTIDLSYKTSNKVIISGDINGEVIQDINNNTHRYLVKLNSTGSTAIIQLMDNDNYSTIDGSDISDYLNDNSDLDFGIFVKVPSFYFKVEEREEEVWLIGICLEKVSEEWLEWKGSTNMCGAFLVNKKINGLFKSLPLLTINKLGDLQRNNVSTLCSLVQGFQAYTMKWNNILKLLFLFKYGTTDVSILGQCANYFNGVKTGDTMDLGMTDTTLDSAAQNFFGIEGLTFPTYIGDTIKEGTENKYTSKDINDTDTTFLYPLSTSQQYNDKSVVIKRLIIDKLNFSPKEIDMIDPTNYELYWCLGTSVYYLGGDYANSDWCYKSCYRMNGNEIPLNGLFSVIPNLKTSSNSEVCTRLVYHGDITEFNNFNDFKNFK